MRSIDPVRLKDSYIALLPGITPEKRKALWVHGRELYPELANYLWDHHISLPESDNEGKAQLGGAMFMFLALVNASLSESLLPTAKSSGLAPQNFPRFGNLPSLRP